MCNECDLTICPPACPYARPAAQKFICDECGVEYDADDADRYDVHVDTVCEYCIEAMKVKASA